MHDSKKKYQVHGVISHVCKFIKCMKIIPTFKCFSTTFYHRQRLTSQKQGYKSCYHCQPSSFSNLSGKK